ncbi:MAG TPA: hypothetical protein VFA48_06915 [Gammaproteobacteria bacterium]|nr:hypothetical protein [Gammaproteobacteria bacterium]
MKRIQPAQRLIAALWFSLVLIAAATLGASAAAMTVGTSQAQVKGSTETVLTDSHGMTLYYSTQDGAQQAKCTGKCAKYWPPLLLSAGKPTGPDSIQSDLGVFDGADGRQVTYKGHPLYTFVHDQKPGEDKGEGVAGHWHVATPSTKAIGSGNQGSSAQSSW